MYFKVCLYVSSTRKCKSIVGATSLFAINVCVWMRILNLIRLPYMPYTVYRKALFVPGNIKVKHTDAMQLNPFSSNFPFSKFKLNFYPTYLLQEKYAYTHTHTHTHMHIECAPFLHSPIEYSPLQAQQLWLHLVRVPTRLARPEALAVRRIR